MVIAHKHFKFVTDSCYYWSERSWDYGYHTNISSWLLIVPITGVKGAGTMVIVHKHFKFVTDSFYYWSERSWDYDYHI